MLSSSDVRSNPQEDNVNTGTIVVVKSGEVLPDDVKAQLLDANKTTFSYATQENGTVDMLCLDGEEPDEKNQVVDLALTLDQIEEGFMEQQRVYHFSNQPTRVDDEQPYAIIVKDQRTLLACVAEGDFPGYAGEAGSTHSNEYHMVTDYLADACKEIYQEAGEDVKKMMDIFASPRFRKGMLGILAPRGTIALIGSQGDPIIFSKNDQGKEYDWGYMSRTFEESKQEEAPPPPPPAATTMTPAEKLAAKLAAKAKDGTKQPGRGSVPTVAAVDPKPVVVGQLGDAPKPTEELVFWDTRLEGRALKNYIRNNFVLTEWGGQLPPAWKTLKSLPARLLKPGSALRAHTKAFQEAGKTPPATEVIADGSATPPPMVPPGMREKAIALSKLPGTMDSYEDIADWEKDYPPWTEQNAIPFEQAVRWGFKALRSLADDKQSIACFVRELQIRVLKHEPELLKAPVAAAPAEPATDTRTAAQKLADKLAAKNKLATVEPTAAAAQRQAG